MQIAYLGIVFLNYHWDFGTWPALISGNLGRVGGNCPFFSDSPAGNYKEDIPGYYSMVFFIRAVVPLYDYFSAKNSGVTQFSGKSPLFLNYVYDRIIIPEFTFNGQGG